MSRVVAACSVLFVLTTLVACKSTPEHSVAIGGKCEKDIDCVNFAECVGMGPDAKVCTKTCNELLAKSDPKEGCPAPMKCEEIAYTQKAGTRVLGTVKRKMCVP